MRNDASISIRVCSAKGAGLSSIRVLSWGETHVMFHLCLRAHMLYTCNIHDVLYTPQDLTICIWLAYMLRVVLTCQSLWTCAYVRARLSLSLSLTLSCPLFLLHTHCASTDWPMGSAPDRSPSVEAHLFPGPGPHAPLCVRSFPCFTPAGEHRGTLIYRPIFARLI